ncbi:MAG: hypothetical protein MN733_11565 [Nitrososphaera sp.]|nr:hypothetical protein [Nitrososphaera sp.]
MKESRLFQIQLFEDLPKGWIEAWSFQGLTPTMPWQSAAMGLSIVPDKLSPAGQTMLRTKPFALRVVGQMNLQPGDYEFRLRSRMHSRFHLDDQVILHSEPPKPKKLTAEEIAAKAATDKKAR